VEIVIFAIGLQLVGPGGDVEAVNNPRIVTQEFEKSNPGAIGLHNQGFFAGLKVDETASPGKVGETAPLGGNEWRMVAVLPRPDDAGMLVQRESDLRLESESCAL
jgi:hypothetical protein